MRRIIIAFVGALALTGCSDGYVRHFPSPIEKVDVNNCQIAVFDARIAASNTAFVTVSGGGQGTVLNVLNGKACPNGSISIPLPDDHSRSVTITTGAGTDAGTMSTHETGKPPQPATPPPPEAATPRRVPGIDDT